MGLFRRESKGRHALGAAVTSIPTGPSVLVVPPPVAAAPVAPEVVVVPASPAVAPSLMTSIAELLASGEAWDDTPGVRAQAPAPLRRTAPSAVAAPRPAPPPLAPPPLAPSLPRVQLGFRDGTTTALDPASSQSLALQELAQTLTRRD